VHGREGPVARPRPDNHWFPNVGPSLGAVLGPASDQTAGPRYSVEPSVVTVVAWLERDN
jgi:hypothetical protein